MRSTPENAVKRKIKALLNAYNVYWYPAVAGPYSIGGIPDFVCCHRGRFLGIEAKAAGKKASALQLLQKQLMETAGAKWFLVDGEETLKELELWLSGNGTTSIT